ncbi:hypothetical protein GCM10010271_00040 [Streptomyces kurssanovii]|nr:hypothetical protein GCM10010271_00040 [Streptomyces kurssanovii]
MSGTGYRFVQCDQTIYAVAVDGRPVARPIRSKGGGVGTGSLRQCLIRAFVLSAGRAPSQSALASLEALAMDTASQAVHLRVAPDPEEPHTIWLDLGHADGTSVCIKPGRWARRDGRTARRLTNPRAWNLLAAAQALAGLWRRERRQGQYAARRRRRAGQTEAGR